MSGFMICNCKLFFIRENCILFLIAGEYDFNAFLKISLCDDLALFTHGSEGTFIDDVCKLSTGCTGSHSCDRVIIHIRIHPDLSSMNLENFLTSFEIRQLYRYTAVKPARTKQRRVQRFRTVGSRKNHDTIIGLEAIHFGQQLIQCLLPFIIAADIS